MAATVVVVGAGVCGLSTAFYIKNKNPDIKVTVISDVFSPNTCSDGAAGIIIPYILAGTQIHLQRRWFKQTVQWLQHLLKQEDAPEIGLSRVSGCICYSKVLTETPEWMTIIPSLHELNQEELKEFPQCAKHGYRFSTQFLNCEQYLPWLAERFQDLGGIIIKRTIKTLAELSDFDVVVNCTGMGARDLVGDKSLEPVRGQVLRVKAPSIKQFFRYESDELNEQQKSCYIYPQINDVVLGGTKQKGDFNETPTAEDTAHILKITSDFVPSLKRAEVIKAWVGLRPSCPCVRVEKEVMNVHDGNGGFRKLNVVHNYGHGGLGLTIHWGTALESAALVFDFLKTTSKL